MGSCVYPSVGRPLARRRRSSLCPRLISGPYQIQTLYPGTQTPTRLFSDSAHVFREFL